MKYTLYAGVAAVALSAGMASAEQVTVFGPWLGPDQENVEVGFCRKVFSGLNRAAFRKFMQPSWQTV